MSKRKAATDLNHDNWDSEQEPEVAGTFQEAPREVVQARVIRPAKRRLQRGPNQSTRVSGENKEPKQLFAGFGVMKTVDPSSVSEITKKSFSFLKKSDTPLNINSSETRKDVDNKDARQTYLAKLRGLNEAVLDWIKEHVQSNPCCILTPVFKDYDNFLKEIQNEEEKTNSAAHETLKDTETSSNSSTAPIFSLSSNKVNNVEEKTEPTFTIGSKDTTDKSPAPTFNFGAKSSSEKLSSPSFSFGAKNSSEKISSPPFLFSSTEGTPPTPSFGLPSPSDAKSESVLGTSDKKSFFNFGSFDKKPLEIKFPSVPPGGNFTFSGINKPAESSGNNDDGGENDEEPQPEPVKPVVEEDAVFTQRVKVFVKKGEGYSDLGVGNLYIKEAPNDWYQAIVRNETSLGNIIFNILLSEQQPTKRVGKNNVMIACIPTPQHTGPAVPVLLRVKTSEDADRLLETIDKYKKK